jgi:predicted NACHT family NTPase
MGIVGSIVQAALHVTGAVLGAGAPRLLRHYAARRPIGPGWVAGLPRLVIVGPGGSGKSTLLKQLLARVAGEGRVPVWLPLTTLPVEGALTPARLLEHLAVQARTQLGLEEANPAFFEALLRDRRLTLGLDALDECGSLARRQKVRNLVDEIARGWDGCQILLTSRPEALRETPLTLLDDDGQPEGGFFALELQPFARADVKPFLVAAFDDGAVLAEQLQRRDDLDALLQAPLTLVLVGLVARAGRGLPAGRTPLFARCVETVCDTW